MNLDLLMRDGLSAPIPVCRYDEYCARGISIVSRAQYASAILQPALEIAVNADVYPARKSVMEKFAWSQEMELGVPQMDDAHKAFVGELLHLAEMPDREFGAGFPALIVGLERDFYEEEMLMEEIGFPGLQSHREQHAKVLGALHHVASELMQGNSASARKALELLPQWFLFHLETMDLALSATLRMAQAPGPSTSIQEQSPLDPGLVP